MAAWTVDFRKHSGPTPADDMAAQIITYCGNFTLDFKQHGFCASPLFLQTLGPWFPNEMQNLLSSEKRTLDHWATVQFFFSTAQVRGFWHCNTYTFIYLFCKCHMKWGTKQTNCTHESSVLNIITQNMQIQWHKQLRVQQLGPEHKNQSSIPKHSPWLVIT